MNSPYLFMPMPTNPPPNLIGSIINYTSNKNLTIYRYPNRVETGNFKNLITSSGE